MKLARPLLLAISCALASACATTGSGPPTAPAPAAAMVATDPAAHVQPEAEASTALVDADAGAPAASVAPAPADGIAQAEAAPETQPDPGDADAETDFAAIYGNPGASPGAPGLAAGAAYDPWEKYNRRVHAFNGAVDRSLARPLARAYVAAVPRPIRAGIGNFFDNLGEPVTVVNSLLQGNGRNAVNALGRFLLNSTLGIGGLIDIADKAKMPNRGEDFGQTMATWGWKRSRYIEVPFLGPRTLRDMFGLAADTPLRPIRYLEDDKTRIFLQGVQAVDLRGRLLAIEAMGEGAVDEYTLYRDIWLQRRNYQINQTAPHRASPADANLPPYLRDGAREPAAAPPSDD